MSMTEQPTLRTARLALVPLSDQHLDHEMDLDADPEVMRYLSGRSMTRAEVEHTTRGGWLPLASCPDWVSGLDLPAQTSPDGGCCNPRMNRTSRRFRVRPTSATACFGNIGARAMPPKARRELIRYGFADLGLTRIFAQTLAVNAPVRATMVAAGLTFARGFTSGDSYDEVLPGAEQGEVEYG